MYRRYYIPVYDNPVPLPRFFIQVKQASDYPFTFLNSYDFKIGVGAIDFSVSEPENNTTGKYMYKRD